MFLVVRFGVFETGYNSQNLNSCDLRYRCQRIFCVRYVLNMHATTMNHLRNINHLRTLNCMRSTCDVAYKTLHNDFPRNRRENASHVATTVYINCNTYDSETVYMQLSAAHNARKRRSYTISLKSIIHSVFRTWKSADDQSNG